MLCVRYGRNANPRLKKRTPETAHGTSWTRTIMPIDLR